MRRYKKTTKTKGEVSSCSTRCISEKWGCALSTSRLPYKLQKLMKKIEIKFILKILFYTVKYKSYISLKVVTPRCSIHKVFLNILQNSPKTTCAGISFIIMLQAVASIPCQEYVKDKILTQLLAFPSSNSFIFCFLLQCSDLHFENFVLYLHCGRDIRSVFRTLLNI